MPPISAKRFSGAAISKESNSSSFEKHLSEGSITSEEFDGPRVAQWVDADDLEENENEEESEIDEIDELDDEHQLEWVQQGLSELPLGAILQAKKAMRNLSPKLDSEEFIDNASNEDDRIEAGSEEVATMAGKSEKQRQRPQIQHRLNKHAPTEMTSKTPVTRLRQVLETKKIKARDPRFSDLSGSLSVDQFRSHYGFLPDMHKNELRELKENLKRAKKLLVSSPRHLREEREQEVQRLERAVKRMESIVNREKQDDAERGALSKIQKVEMEKRKAGKKGWWLKESEKRDIKARARIEAIANEGGKNAVKKAIQKKQRKVGQKEKRARPFGRPARPEDRQVSHDNDLFSTRKRPREADRNVTSSKRSRVD